LCPSIKLCKLGFFSLLHYIGGEKALSRDTRCVCHLSRSGPGFIGASKIRYFLLRMPKRCALKIAKEFFRQEQNFGGLFHKNVYSFTYFRQMIMLMWYLLITSDIRCFCNSIFNCWGQCDQLVFFLSGLK
jgi:hypothetical protein